LAVIFKKKTLTLKELFGEDFSMQNKQTLLIPKNFTENLFLLENSEWATGKAALIPRN
jgi:dTDP-4-dehydrorhamnose 3,5-epimerase-like enzyme